MSKEPAGRGETGRNRRYVSKSAMFIAEHFSCKCPPGPPGRRGRRVLEVVTERGADSLGLPGRVVLRLSLSNVRPPVDDKSIIQVCDIRVYFKSGKLGSEQASERVALCCNFTPERETEGVRARARAFSMTDVGVGR